jgi:hypothetical protein
MGQFLQRERERESRGPIASTGDVPTGIRMRARSAANDCYPCAYTVTREVRSIKWQSEWYVEALELIRHGANYWTGSLALLSGSTTFLQTCTARWISWTVEFQHWLSWHEFFFLAMFRRACCVKSDNWPLNEMHAAATAGGLPPSGNWDGMETPGSRHHAKVFPMLIKTIPSCHPLVQQCFLAGLASAVAVQPTPKLGLHVDVAPAPGKKDFRSCGVGLKKNPRFKKKVQLLHF